MDAGRDYDKMGSVDLAYDLLLVAVLSLIYDIVLDVCDHELEREGHFRLSPSQSTR